MKVRCIINVHYVRDLINKNGNIVPATDIIESMLLEEFETIEVSEEQYQYMQAFCSDGELHSLDEMRDDLNVFYKQLSTPRLAYIEKMYKDYIMDSRPMECKQRIKAFVDHRDRYLDSPLSGSKRLSHSMICRIITNNIPDI